MTRPTPREPARPLPPVVVFDLDGTLVDSAPALRAALNDVLAELGGRPVSAVELRSMMGHRLRGLVARALAASALDHPVDPVLERLRDHYDRHCTRGVRPFEGAAPALDQLGVRHRLAVCTNKPRRPTEQILERLGWTERFEAVSAWGDVPEGKPHPALLHRVMATLRVPPRDVLLVGDTANDAGAARAAGVRFVAVSYGYARGPVGALGAERIIDDLRQLAPSG